MKNAIVVGSNRGIGLELCRNLKESYQVTALCRQTSEELSSLGVQVIEGVDITDTLALNNVAKEFSNSVDLLLVVAGIMRDEILGDLNFDTILEQFQVNTLGPLKVTEAFLSKIPEGGKIAMVTSRMGSLADNTSGGRYGYRMSKAALNMAVRSLAVDLEDKGITVLTLHPGYVRTDMTGGSGLINADESATGLVKVIENHDIKDSGTFWHSNGEVLPW